MVTAVYALLLSVSSEGSTCQPDFKVEETIRFWVFQ